MEETLDIQVPDTYKDVAKKIIKSSIRSAICLDDVFEEPYMTTEEKDELKASLTATGLEFNSEIPKGLYKSFRSNGKCDLDIYNFKTFEESWHPEYMLNNKDLVILDWELEGKDGYTSTLKILKEIIDSDKIPFIIIYTYKPVEDFIEISRHIIEAFNLYKEEDLPNLKQEFIAQFEEHIKKVSTNKDWESDKVELFFELEEISKILLEIAVFTETRSNNINLLIERISTEFTIETAGSGEKKIKTILNNVFKNEISVALQQLAYVFIGSETDTFYDLARIETKDVGFKINNCILTLFSKPGDKNEHSINAENVFTKFSELISSAPHNFITLLALEMRDRFKEDLSKIGNDISLIDEKAFFVHLKNYKNRFPDNYKNQFYDFLLNSWINELSNYNINLKPSIFEVMDEYVATNDFQELKGSDHIVPLANLASILSSTLVENRFEKDNKIRFGDIFNKIDIDNQGVETVSKDFFLSITPHCVCVDECKIDNNFYFIKSEDSSDDFNSALKKMEIEHYSIIKTSSVFKSIKWGECKPFTTYISPNTIDNLLSTYQNKNIKLKYVSTLKENFAQRIANKAFGYGTSIGIDLPHL